jgi:sugar/nucleoside kinase (ribokinase family)
VARGIFVGLSTIDILYNVDQFPSPNSKVVARSQDVLVGGPATNASITFRHLGGKSTLVTVVGCHALASVIQQELEGYSVQLIDLNPNFEKVPVVSSISVKADGERNIVSTNAARVNAPSMNVPDHMLGDGSVLLVDGHYMSACQAWAKAARARGIVVVFDGGSWKSGTDELLKNVDVVICSADFLPPGCVTESEVIQYLSSYRIANIAITNGAEPVRFVSHGRSGTVQVPQVDVVDTMGAGDIYHGAFCHYYSLGRGFVDALSEAAKIAAESCRFSGTRGWMKEAQNAQPPVAADASSPAGVPRVQLQSEKRSMGKTKIERNSPERRGDREPTDMDRRMFYYTAVAAISGVAAALFGGACALEGAPDFIQKWKEHRRRQQEAVEREEELRRLLLHYLYPLNPGSDLEARVPLVPAMQDPWGPPTRVFSGSGNAVASAYASTFVPRVGTGIVQPVIDIFDDDAPVLIASHLVSAPAARYFGDPKSPRPIHHLYYHDDLGGFKAELRWTIYTPAHARVVVKRELFQGIPDLRSEPVHELSDLDNPKLPQPAFIRQDEIDYQQDDYLLISVLPRDSRFDRRMVSLAGLHKPGTLAAELFLNSPALTLKILKEIDKSVRGLSYYQALIALRVDHNSGSPRPFDLVLKGSQAIGVTPMRQSHDRRH